MARRPGPPLPHVLQLRLTDRQRRALELIAQRADVGLAQAARLTIEAEIASTDWLDGALRREGLTAAADSEVGALLDAAASGSLKVHDDAS
jgi:hypothetical protein